jgi:hypothetical protein
MKEALTTIGIALQVLSLISFAYQGITYTKSEKVLEVGPITGTKETDGPPQGRRDAFESGRGWALANGPALEDAIELQAEIIVKPTSGMLLNDVCQMPRQAPDRSARLRGALEVPLAAICLEWHGWRTAGGRAGPPPSEGSPYRGSSSSTWTYFL